MELNSNAITGSGICSSPVPPPSTPSTAVLGRAGTGGTPAPRERRRGHRGRRRSEGEAEGAAIFAGRGGGLVRWLFMAGVIRYCCRYSITTVRGRGPHGWADCHKDSSRLLINCVLFYKTSCRSEIYWW
jgi:hypothetical protein